MMEHKCVANSYGARIFFDSGGWYVGGKAWEDQYNIDRCPYCGVKLEKPEPPDAKPDDEITVTPDWLETWIHLVKETPAYGDFREMLARSIRAVIPVGRSEKSPDKIEVSRDDLSMLVCEANQMVVDLSYGRSVAVRAKNQWRRLREMLYDQREEETEHQSLARKRIASYALIEDWYRRLREVADDECSWSGARKMLHITDHMRALLNCYREKPEPPPAKVEPELPEAEAMIEVSRKVIESWVLRASRLECHTFAADIRKVLNDK